jgi:hypothetical protein
MRFLFSLALVLAIVLSATSALADKVAVLPFRSTKNVPRAELEPAREWTRKAVEKKGHTLPTPGELANAELAVKDGIPDTTDELRAAAKASGSPWALSAQVERIDYPPADLPDGTHEDAWTTYRVELEACEVQSGRVESVAREIVPDEAPDQIAEMIGFLVRPGGIGPNAVFPWQGQPVKRPPPKPKPAEPPPPPPPPKPEEPPPPKHAYAEGHPFAIGASAGVTNAISRPEKASGPSWALPIGLAFGYALDALPGLELRGIFTSQVVGPKAVEIAGGARYAIPVLAQYRIFVGPEALVGGHIAIGAEKTGRFILHGAAFAAWGVTEQLQLELAGDLAGAFGGSGSLVLGGGTARVLLRF